MSRPARPALIGLFALLGAVLALGSVIFFGSMRIWDKEEVFLIYFRESVNGLSVGSPVRFKGVAVGSVSDIRLSYNQDDSIEGFYIPVFVRLRESLVSGPGRGTVEVDLSDWEEFRRRIADGMRGRLVLDSIISGQLFIELDYFAEPGEPYILVQKGTEYREIPSVPSIMAEIGSSAADVVAQLGAVDVETISVELIRLLRNANAVVDEIDMAAWNASVVGAGRSIQNSLNDLELKSTVERIDSALDSFTGLVAELEGSLPGAIEDVRKVAQELAEAAARSQSVLANIEGITGPDTDLQRELMDTFRNLRRAARSARELLDYLDRNPSALLRGRDDDD